MEHTSPMGTPSIGFVGIGVMGQAMATNLVQRSGRSVVVHDLDPDRIEAMRKIGVEVAPTLADLSAKCDVVFLSLPNARAVESVVLGAGGLADTGHNGQTVVDLSTSTVALARELSAQLRERGISFLDAPVSRTHSAAVAGTLAITVGAADRGDFDRIEPLLRFMATDITLCGRPGAGTLVKLLNNLIVFETVVALSEAITVARRSGLIDDKLFFDALSRGSASSFALTNHGMKSLLPDTHPVGLFSSEYMLKDIGYALGFARDLGISTELGDTAEKMLGQAVEYGYGDQYHTVVVRVVEKNSLPREEISTLT